MYCVISYDIYILTGSNYFFSFFEPNPTQYHVLIMQMRIQHGWRKILGKIISPTRWGILLSAFCVNIIICSARCFAFIVLCFPRTTHRVYCMTVLMLPPCTAWNTCIQLCKIRTPPPAPDPSELLQFAPIVFRFRLMFRNGFCEQFTQ